MHASLRRTAAKKRRKSWVPVHNGIQNFKQNTSQNMGVYVYIYIYTKSHFPPRKQLTQYISSAQLDFNHLACKEKWGSRLWSFVGLLFWAFLSLKETWTKPLPPHSFVLLNKRESHHRVLVQVQFHRCAGGVVWTCLWTSEGLIYRLPNLWIVNRFRCQDARLW